MTARSTPVIRKNPTLAKSAVQWSDIPIAAGPTAVLAPAFRNRPRQCAQKGAIGIIVQQAITSQRLRF